MVLGFRQCRRRGSSLTLAVWVLPGPQSRQSLRGAFVQGCFGVQEV